DARLDVRKPRGGGAISEILRLRRGRGQAHAQGLHPEGEPADRARDGPRRSHAGRRAVQIPVGPADRAAIERADPDSFGKVVPFSVILRRSHALACEPRRMAATAGPSPFEARRAKVHAERLRVTAEVTASSSAARDRAGAGPRARDWRRAPAAA